MRWQRVNWSAEAEAVLKPALCGDGAAIRAEVDQGAAVLWWVEGHGYIVTRLEGEELVLVAWAGVSTGPIVEHVQAVARANGVKTIRFHTQHNPAVITRMVKKWGFQPVETVYRWVA